jgi:hypothetical protein
MDLSPITLPTTTGEALAFADYRGRRAALLLGNQRTRALVPEIAHAVHAGALAADVPILQVAHLVGVPRVLRRIAERDTRRGLEAQRRAAREQRAARGLPPDDVARLVVLGLDWEGRVTTPLGFSSADRTPLAAVIDERSHVTAVVREGDIAERLTDLLTAAAPAAH